MPRKKIVDTEQLQEAVAIPEISDNMAVDDTTEPTKPASFYELDIRELDRDLSPDQLSEWTDIYASFRSQTPLSGMIIGVDTYRMELQNSETKEWETQEISCLVLMDYRVKVIIPESEIWHSADEQLPGYVVRNMVGANIDYVVTKVDREGNCAIASRREALGFKRRQFINDRRRHVGEVVKANILCVGPKRLVLECGGFDVQLTNRDISYAAIADLRREYRPGDEISAKIMAIDRESGSFSISVKEVNPNPYNGAEERHPVGCSRKAVISGTYKGGVFCRLSDDTTVLCSYKPGMFDDEFFIGDSVLVRITRYNDEVKQVYGRLMVKW